VVRRSLRVVAFSFATIVAAAPAVCAQEGTSSKLPGQHKVSKKHPPSVSGSVPWYQTQARGSTRKGNSGASGCASCDVTDRAHEACLQAGGCGGGGGGGGSGM
jgi:hypothetical protein